MIKNNNISKQQLQNLKVIWSLQEQSQGLKQYKYFDEIKDIPFRAADINMYLGKGNYFDIIHPITKNICKKPKYGYPNIDKITGKYKKISGQNKYEFIGEIIQISDSKILCGNLIFGMDENKIPDYKNELDILSHPDTIINITGSEDRYLTKLFKGIKVFDYPKPLKLIDYLLDISTKEEDIVLDFFAGSGTTAESAFNKNRKFILIQYPEIIKKETKEKLIKKDFNNIDTIYDITKKRLELTNVEFKEQ
jgi:adenine-specific DNA-methyltransferase